MKTIIEQEISVLNIRLNSLETEKSEIHKKLISLKNMILVYNQLESAMWELGTIVEADNQYDIIAIQTQIITFLETQNHVFKDRESYLDSKEQK